MYAVKFPNAKTWLKEKAARALVALAVSVGIPDGPDAADFSGLRWCADLCGAHISGVQSSCDRPSDCRWIIWLGSSYVLSSVAGWIACL
jgi:hypothetical protein